MIRILNKLKEIFKVKNNLQLVIVFLVFGVSGSLSVYVSKPALSFLDINRFFNNDIIILIIRVFVIFPLYQIILITVGTLFGQFNYFWSFQKKFFKKFLIKS